MLSLNSIKKIKSLKTKKGRDAEKLFLIEGIILLILLAETKKTIEEFN